MISTSYRLLNPVYCSLNNNAPKKTIKIPPKKEALRKKLKYALMYCDVESTNYKNNKPLCDYLWDEVNELAQDIKNNT